MKKKVILTISAILGILLLSAAVFAIWQKDNINAFIMSRKYSSNELLEKMSENDEELKVEIEKYFPEGIREYTEEEKQQIDSGEVSEKQMLAKILSEKNEEFEAKENMTDDERETYEKIIEIQKKIAPEIEIKVDKSDVIVPKPIENKTTNQISVVGKPSKNNTQSVPQKVTKPNSETIISKYVSRLYSLESKYLSAIDGIVASAKSEAKSKGLTKKDTSQLLSIGAKYTGRINSLEASCDSEVEAVISNLTRELSAIGASTDIVSTIRTAYANEKSLKRAYYMNMIY